MTRGGDLHDPRDVNGARGGRRSRSGSRGGSKSGGGGNGNRSCCGGRSGGLCGFRYDPGDVNGARGGGGGGCRGCCRGCCCGGCGRGQERRGLLDGGAQGLDVLSDLLRAGGGERLGDLCGGVGVCPPREDAQVGRRVAVNRKVERRESTERGLG